MGKWTTPILGIGVVWFPFGHILLSGGGGWMLLVGIFFFMPVYAVVAGIHIVLVHAYSAKVGQRATGPMASPLALIVCVLVVLYPFCSQDFGDSGPGVPSRLTAWFGVPEATANFLWGMVLIFVLLAAAAMIFADIIDLIRLRRVPSLASQAPGQPYPGQRYPGMQYPEPYEPYQVPDSQGRQYPSAG